MRAWSHHDAVFCDFRTRGLLEISPGRPSAIDPAADDAWHELVMIVIAPHARLSPAEASAIELDYGMTDREVRFEVRRAMLSHVLVDLGLLDDENETARREIRLVNTEILRRVER